MTFTASDHVLVATYDFTREGFVPAVIQARVVEARYPDWVLVATSDGHTFPVRVDYLFSLDRLSDARVKAMQRTVDALTRWERRKEPDNPAEDEHG